MEAEELLALEAPAFLALIGQTRIHEPERQVGEAIAQIQQVEDEIQRGQLLIALASLITDEEVIKVVEKLLDPLDEYLLELPYPRRLLQKGREEGREEGLAEGREKGLEEGKLAGLREAIQEIIIQRFDPPAREYHKVSRQLEDLISEETLQRLLVATIQAEDMVAFTSRLADELAGDKS